MIIYLMAQHHRAVCNIINGPRVGLSVGAHRIRIGNTEDHFLGIRRASSRHANVVNINLVTAKRFLRQSLASGCREGLRNGKRIGVGNVPNGQDAIGRVIRRVIEGAAARSVGQSKIIDLLEAGLGISMHKLDAVQAICVNRDSIAVVVGLAAGIRLLGEGINARSCIVNLNVGNAVLIGGIGCDQRTGCVPELELSVFHRVA